MIILQAALYPGVSNESEESRKKRPMSSSRNGTLEGLAFAQRILGRLKHTSLRSVNLVLDPKSARTRLGTRQVLEVRSASFGVRSLGTIMDILIPV